MTPGSSILYVYHQKASKSVSHLWKLPLYDRAVWCQWRIMVFTEIASFHHFELCKNMSAAVHQIDSLLYALENYNNGKDKLIIAIGSTNPTKINSVKMTVSKLFPNHDIEYKFSSVKSGVSDQPKSSTESLKGATNRAKNVCKLFPNADYSVGIEGGMESVMKDDDDKEIYLQSGWVVVMNKEGEIGIGTSARVECSDKIVNKINNENKELGVVMDEISGKKDVKTHQGFFGLITNNHYPRALAYHHGCLFAFAKFISPKIYWY